MKITVLVIAVGCLAAGSLGQDQDCPKECSCTDGLASIARCSQLDTQMLFPERVKHLVLDSLPDLKINLTNGFFTKVGLHHILSIQITNCSISFIDSDAFQNLDELTDVDLSDNRLILIHPDTFESNGRLERLTLSGNPLQLTQLLEAEENYFLQSSSLLELVLSRCQLSDIGPKLLSRLPNLRYLNLNSNNIKVIDDFIFEKVPLLEEIDLSKNMLMSLNDEIFESIDELTTLNLKNNMIETIDDLDMPGLKDLDVSYNKIKLLRKNTFEGLPDVSTLNISNNEITWISEETFTDLTELKHLDLSHNALVGPLPKFIFEDNEFLETLSLAGNKEMRMFEGFSTELPKLYLLDISDCGLPIITNSSFSGMPSLAILNISVNSLNTLNHVIMSKLHRLNVLDLSHNSITKLGTYTFASNSHLRKLFLSHNTLHHLPPDTFESTPYLSYLDLSHNQFSYIWHLNESQYMKENKILNQLEYLNIAGNKLKELHKSHFSHLDNLKAIDVSGNPLVCTAEFPAFIEWMYSSQIRPLHHDGRSDKQEEKLEKSNLQWDDLLMDVCQLQDENIVIKRKPVKEELEDQSKEHDLKFYQYTVIEDVKLSEGGNDGHAMAASAKSEKLAEEINTYIWPTFLIVFSLVFLTLAIGNTVALLIYRHRNQGGASPFRRTVVKLDPTPRYHKLYEECSVPNTPIVKSSLLGNLVYSQIKGTGPAKPKTDDVV